jgi:hypothetical protein
MIDLRVFDELIEAILHDPFRRAKRIRGELRDLGNLARRASDLVPGSPGVVALQDQAQAWAKELVVYLKTGCRPRRGPRPTKPQPKTLWQVLTTFIWRN